MLCFLLFQCLQYKITYTELIKNINKMFTKNSFRIYVYYYIVALFLYYTDHEKLSDPQAMFYMRYLHLILLIMINKDLIR